MKRLKSLVCTTMLCGFAMGVVPYVYGQPGPRDQSVSERSHASHFQARDPGPGRGAGLPEGARELWIGSVLYFIGAGSYYLWNAERDRYETVPEPVADNSYEVIAYPSEGQTDHLQALDRYECYGWAVQQSGFDPARAQSAPAQTVASTYRRALVACLQGRGYSVQ